MSRDTRKNIGRPAKDGARDLQRYNVSLDDESYWILRALGDGYLSLGVRKAAKAIREQQTG